MQETRRSYTLEENEGRAVWFAGALMITKADGAQTDGRFNMMDQRVPPGYSVPLHVHRDEDEAWYILEGRATFYCADEQIEAGPGSWVFLPKGVPHVFKVGPEGGRLLTLTAPGGFADFVAEAGEPAPSLSVPPPSEPDTQRLAEIAAKYGIEILGPPLE